MKNKKFVNELIEILLSIKTKKEMRHFLVSLLTLDELETLPKRLQIVKMLKKGVNQREIAKKLKVSISSVTNGSIEIQRGHFKNIKTND